MDEVYLLVGMALVTFGIRYSMFVLAGRYEFPPQITDALRYVPPAVLTAITVPAVLIHSGDGIDLSLTNPYLIGALAAGAVGWVTNNLLLTIMVGMVAFWSWQWYLL